MSKLALRLKRSLAYKLVEFIIKYYPDKRNPFDVTILTKKYVSLKGKQRALEAKYASLETSGMASRAQIAALRDQFARLQAERKVLLEQIRGQQAVIDDQQTVIREQTWTTGEGRGS